MSVVLEKEEMMILFKSRTLTATFVALVILGCSDSTGTDDAEFSISSDRMSYASGDVVKVNVKNESGRTILVNPCFLDLQVREPAGWRTVAARGCIDFDLSMLRELAPQGVFADSADTTPNLAAGEYRLLFDLRAERVPSTVFPEDRRPLQVSNTFRIE
jgi:hypothetical protein